MYIPYLMKFDFWPIICYNKIKNCAMGDNCIMARKKNVAKSLIDSAESAIFAGIEIHNKPRIPYRYPTATLLIINAWELALKAYVYKYIGKKKIYEESNHTISFSKALAYVQEHINSLESNKNFNAVRENLYLLSEYRNNITHYFENELDPIIFMLLSKATMNFNIFIEKYFNREIAASENLVILPIGFSLPFEPIKYLNKKATDDVSNIFVTDVLNAIKRLNDEGVMDSIVVGFEMFVNSVKNISNADIIAAIDPSNYDAVALTKEYRFTDNPKAPAIRIDEAELIKQKYPYSYKELIKKVKEKLPHVKINGQFSNYLKLIKENKEWYMERLLNPLNPRSSKTGFYGEKAIEKLVELYTDKKTTT